MFPSAFTLTILSQTTQTPWFPHYHVDPPYFFFPVLSKAGAIAFYKASRLLMHGGVFIRIVLTDIWWLTNRAGSPLRSKTALARRWAKRLDWSASGFFVVALSSHYNWFSLIFSLAGCTDGRRMQICRTYTQMVLKPLTHWPRTGLMRLSKMLSSVHLISASHCRYRSLILFMELFPFCRQLLYVLSRVSYLLR